MILIFLLLSFVFSQSCKVLTGTWLNELGSIAKLRASSGGELSGTYNSGVGQASGDYELRGRFDQSCNSVATTLSFSVSWVNQNTTSHSSSSWTGVLINDTIYTTWLLTNSVRSINDVWSATRVGTNVFSRK